MVPLHAKQQAEGAVVRHSSKLSVRRHTVPGVKGQGAAHPLTPSSQTVVWTPSTVLIRLVWLASATGTHTQC